MKKLGTVIKKKKKKKTEISGAMREGYPEVTIPIGARNRTADQPEN